MVAGRCMVTSDWGMRDLDGWQWKEEWLRDLRQLWWLPSF